MYHNSLSLTDDDKENHCDDEDWASAFKEPIGPLPETPSHGVVNKLLY